ncbi:MAG: siphovirus ReqiPepy6 Gp37-like family protein, partial [Clostridiales bacterium]|nr:siphovirus ReqiPepy6 Gp37-like family protein [Clostridiales bacterium]
RIAAAITDIVKNEITNPSDSDKRISNFIIGATALDDDPAVSLDYQSRANVFDMIQTVAQKNNIGFRVWYDIPGKRLVFDLYNTTVSDRVVFSRKRKNIAEQEIFSLWADYKNVVYVGDTPIGSATGLDRREMSISAVSGESAQQAGEKALRERQKVETVDIRIDQDGSQYVYLQDWNLGYTVTFRDDLLDVEIKQTIVEVQEFYELGSQKIDTIFGDYLPKQGR